MRTFWNEKKVISAIKKCKSRTEFTKKYKGAYNWIHTNNKINLLDKFIKKINAQSKFKQSYCIKEAKKYNTLNDFRIKSKGEYQWLWRNKKLHLIKNLFKNKYTLKSCLTEASKYRSRKEFYSCSRWAYTWLQKNNKLSELDKVFPKKITKNYIDKKIFNKVS